MELAGAPGQASVFDRLNTQPIINACGIFTDLGGSRISGTVWADLTELNDHFVDMIELLDQTGQIIAGLVGSEAARVVPGASAGIALSVAACMTGRHGPYWEQLPDTSGMRNEVVLQHPQAAAYKYINPIRISGAKVVLAGSPGGVTADELASAITDRTAALLIPAHLDGLEGTVGLTEAVAIAKAAGVKLIVDAAYQFHPPEQTRLFAELGADLAIFSSKYYGGPNAGGFISGSRELIDVVAGLDFTRFESGQYRTFGRPFKMGRYDIAAVTLCLVEWFEADQSARMARERDLASRIRDRLASVPGIEVELKCYTLDARLIDEPVNAAVISFPRAGISADELADRLARQRPSIRTLVEDGKMIVVTEVLRGGEETLIADRIAALLSGSASHD